MKDFEYAARFFERHERAAVFFGRMIPAVRSVISIPAGSVRMTPSAFFLISVSGIFIWNCLLIAAGFVFLSDIHVVDTYINPISDLILLGFILAYLFQVIRFIRSDRSDPAA